MRETTSVPNAKEMIIDMVKSHETVVRSVRAVFALTEKAMDEATAEVLTQRIQLHEKTVWMLRSLFENG